MRWQLHEVRDPSSDSTSAAKSGKCPQAPTRHHFCVFGKYKGQLNGIMLADGKYCRNIVEIVEMDLPAASDEQLQAYMCIKLEGSSSIPANKVKPTKEEKERPDVHMTLSVPRTPRTSGSRASMTPVSPWECRRQDLH